MLTHRVGAPRGVLQHAQGPFGLARGTCLASAPRAVHERSRTRDHHRALAAAVGATVLLIALAARAEPPEPNVEIDGDPHAGHVTLTWGPREGAEEGVELYQVEEATRRDFENARMQYEGRHTSSVISGLPNGTYYYRVRYQHQSDGSWSDWSSVEEFTVEHYSLRLAGALFGLGALVVLATAGFIIRQQKEV